MRTRRGQALMELAVGMFALALVVKPLARPAVRANAPSDVPTSALPPPSCDPNTITTIFAGIDVVESPFTSPLASGIRRELPTQQIVVRPLQPLNFW